MANKRLALAGNPNCGKTTLFNSLTGATAHVGNWPGVTVEQRIGVYKDKKNGVEFDVIDLPGIYSLSPYTPEEVISRNYIIDEKPDVVINVVDGTNLERNLYMTSQILEMDVPMVVAVNMADVLDKRGLSIDLEALSKKLGVPVVAISALHQKGLKELIAAAEKAAESPRTGTSILPYKTAIDQAVAVLGDEDEPVPSPLFHAIKLLEKDELEIEAHPKAYERVQEVVGKDGIDYEASIADERYKYLTALCKEVAKGRVEREAEKLTKSDKIDKVLTHRVFGILIVIVIMFLIFHLTFTEDLFYLGAMGVNFGDEYPGFITYVIGDEEIHMFEGLFWTDGGINGIGTICANFVVGICDAITAGVGAGLELAGAESWAIGFICDGCLAGVFAVIGFVPQILVLFAFLSILEDTGYMARVAFILDRIFRRFGVSGRAFIPMIMGFGCGIPAMMNTRTLASDKERTKTIRVIPFFTCGAKSEFLIMIAAAVGAVIAFPTDLFVFLIYGFGVVVAICAIIVMNITSQREEVPPFIMELPEYHNPQAKALGIHIWDKGKHFIKKAFTIILLSTIVVWFFSHFNWQWTYLEEADTANSILGGLGSLLSPLFVPLGFGNVQTGSYSWTYVVGSVEGIIAKENVTGVMESLAAGYGFETFAELVSASGITTAGLVAFAVFNMLTIPCFASVATAKSELKDVKTYHWTLLFWLGLSYGLACLAYITFEWVWTLAITLPLLAVAIFCLVKYNMYMNDKEKKAAAESAE